MPGATVRRIYATSSDAYYPGKIERDLSLVNLSNCIEGVPKRSPNDTRLLLFRACAGERFGIYVGDTTGTDRTWIAEGFGPDWNPTWKP